MARNSNQIAIRLGDDKSLKKDFINLRNEFKNEGQSDTYADVLRFLINHYNKTKDKKLPLSGEVPTNTKDISKAKAEKAIESLIKYNTNQKKAIHRLFINVGMIRAMAGTDGTITKRVYQTYQEQIDKHHHSLGITTDNNAKLRNRETYPSYRVTKSREIKKLYYDIAKDNNLLEYFNLENVNTQETV